MGESYESNTKTIGCAGESSKSGSTKGQPPVSRARASTVRSIVMQMSFCTPLCSRATVFCSSESRVTFYSQTNRLQQSANRLVVKSSFASQ